jgi:type I restriction-modification system DNA methylase subunit
MRSILKTKKKSCLNTNINLNRIEGAFHKIGYKRNLTRRNYIYANFFSEDIAELTVDLGIFGQEPLDYRSACFGIHFVGSSNKTSESIANDLRAFGAPQIFIIDNGNAERWIVKETEVRFQERIRTNRLPYVIESNQSKWKPDSMIRAKSGFAKPEVQQLDFVDIGLLPALEHEASKKIDTLLNNILHNTEVEFKRNRFKFDASILFHIVFSFLAAKVLRDKDIAADIDFSLPQETLKRVYKHYGAAIGKGIDVIPPNILQKISLEVGKGFSLRNISVDTLTYIYENTFVSPESRKKLGIHSTPSYVADYVLSQMPIEDIPRDKRHVLDPMCGHGIFLISAMRRMRELLPKDWSSARRHKYFTTHLHGIEVDSFSVEVARMCLMLADFPESNTWHIEQEDVFSGEALKKNISKAMLLIGNPPFEIIEGKSPDTPKPRELLRLVLPDMPNGSLIGMVLPQSFLDGSDYKDIRNTLLINFEILNLTTLPDRIFKYSNSKTSIVIARKNKPNKNSITIYREVRDQQKDEFQARNKVTWEDNVQQEYFISNMRGQLVVPFLREIWTYLEDNPRIDNFIEIKIGVQYDYKQVKDIMHKVIRDKAFPNSKSGIANTSKGFVQYTASDTVYLSTEKKYQRRKAWNYDWRKPKIIVPASGMSRGPWRYAAAIDMQGRLISRNFYAIWSKSKDINIETLAAILNSPVAQAFVYSHSSYRTIPKRVYSSIPVPKKMIIIQPFIDSLVKQYLWILSRNKEAAKDLLLQIDSEIIKAYELPPRLERQLLDIFWGQRRHVPFNFMGYIPPEQNSWIPLHIYISEQYKEATPYNILKKLPVIKDKDFIKYLKSIGA